MAAPKVPRCSGTIKSFDARSGIGYIRPDDAAAEDVFFHVSAVASVNDPCRGDRVTFAIGAGKRGRSQAISILLLKEDEAA